MNHLTRSDYATALQLLARVEAQAEEVEGFAIAAAKVLDEFVGSDSTILCVCDLLNGRRKAVSSPSARQRCDGSAGIGQRFTEPSLARYQGLEPNDAVTLPLYRDGRTVVSIVLNRRGANFDGRHRARLELLLPHLAFLCAHACQGGGAPAGAEPPWTSAGGASAGLTAREREVLRWLACGKTDADIASLLSISPRTVNKHLEHIYVKLGVETRTAAVMRALSARLVDRDVLPVAAPGESPHGAAAPPWPAVEPRTGASRNRSPLRPKPA